MTVDVVASIDNSFFGLDDYNYTTNVLQMQGGAYAALMDNVADSEVADAA